MIPEQPTSDVQQLLIFQVAGQHYALPAVSVVKVIRSVAVTRLQGEHDSIEGVIDLQSLIVPVVNLHARLNMPVSKPKLSDQFVIVINENRHYALRVDEVLDTIFFRDVEICDAHMLIPNRRFLRGIMHRANGLLLVEDLAALLHWPTSEQAAGDSDDNG